MNRGGLPEQRNYRRGHDRYHNIGEGDRRQLLPLILIAHNHKARAAPGGSVLAESKGKL